SCFFQRVGIQCDDGVYLRTLLVVRLNTVEIEAYQLFRGQRSGVDGRVYIGNGCGLKIERGLGMGRRALGEAPYRNQKAECDNCDGRERALKLSGCHQYPLIGEKKPKLRLRVNLTTARPQPQQPNSSH